MSEEIRGPNAPWPIELDGIAASVTSESADWSGTVEGRLRAEEARGRVRIQLVQWDHEDHEVSVNVSLTVEQARALATALRTEDTETVRADRGSGWVNVGWIQQHDLGDDHDPDGTEVAVATVERYTDWCEVSLRWEGEDGGQVSVETALEDGQVAAFRSWLGYAIALAEAYEPSTPSESQSASASSGGLLANVLPFVVGMGVSVGIGVLVANALFSRTDMTINGEPLTAPSTAEIVGVMGGFVLLVLFILWALKHAPGKMKGGRHA